MSAGHIQQLLAQPVGWLADSGPSEDIAISSRIRLARNLSGHFFPVHASDEQLQAVANLVAESCAGLPDDRLEFSISELDENDRMLLFERRLVSRELFKRPTGAKLLVTPDECSSIMVNEEDHLRLQGLLPGLQLEKVYEQVNRLDDQLAGTLDFAFDPKLGFLTSCPTNLGTGMRASVMLHLPGLVMTKEIGRAVQGITQLHLTVRGIFGEGSDNRGNLFQISNQSTLGESESEIIGRLGRVIAKLIEGEKFARGQLLSASPELLYDRVGRAYGTLRYSYILSVEEALNSLSMLRLGVDMGMFTAVDIHTVNDLFVKVNPAHLKRLTNSKLPPDAARAAMVREILKRG
ncbi:MAG: ATP--guanido phosphotransferase [Victivallaceae bacterium]|nr:protein arginine kinase [Victivallaceae bacterium]